MKIRNSLLIAVLFATSFCSQTPKDGLPKNGGVDTLYIASWNIENLFDATDDINKEDEEFLPDGRKEWTQERIDNKIKHLSRVIKWMNNGNGPDILGVQEVEHKHLLETLLKRHFTDKNYKIAYAESPDMRGIDNGLIYNADKFKVLSVEPIFVELPNKHPTRSILEVEFESSIGEKLLVYVNHWPSRGGGEEKTRPNRIKAAKVLRAKIDSLFERDKNKNIVILGDFNDELNNRSLSDILWVQEFTCSTIINPKRLYDLSYEEFKAGYGTYLYHGDWNMLDHMIISNGLLSSGKIKYVCNSFELIKPDFMLTKRGKYKGAATPTFGGRKYIGGYSDHIPVGAKFIFK